ncbi:hypothetical protein TBLA_0I01580 [Henningerozyma blattae CBS 6284]|uniref:dolichol kinase n=1 Tax=Henningerozyma blattae (strain ATCC 34711 / CBS 6284 / DSM 70876 / NBRC 10599 / NRRL Y-10934 / UCD 77-7) TaxID=1071380 RepID=I2H8W5_HENB6|nr:hypothetical protein TBLA_0I01580 [Tetrapisispora blattae CBS 6284]CCH62817.1 hypothetical protein TBLA_0I01580 [Tetrapisispora blattae CBS 6284]
MAAYVKSSNLDNVATTVTATTTITTLSSDSISEFDEIDSLHSEKENNFYKNFNKNNSIYSNNNSVYSQDKISYNFDDEGSMEVLQFQNYIQSAIIIFTVLIANDKFNLLMPRDYQAMIKVELLGVLPIFFITYANKKFDFVYLFYLPFFVSLTCLKNNMTLTIINSILLINILEFSFFRTIVIQSILILWVYTNDFKLSTNINAWYLIPIPIILNHCFARILMKISKLKSLDIIECNIFSVLLTNILFLIHSDAIYFQILKVTLSSLFITISINFVISYLIFDRLNIFKTVKPIHKSLILLLNFIVLFPMLITNILKSIDNRSPLNWLFNYILSSNTRQNILTIWLSILLLSIPTVTVFKNLISLNTSRKVWHFLILLCILKPFKMDPNFVKLSLSGSIIIILSVEYLRFLNLEPFDKVLNNYLKSFADARDSKGPLIISYIYLIVGVSTPLLFKDSPVGLISLGIGDSMASIVGQKIGKIKWPNSKKTIEGTLAFIVCTTITSVFLQTYLGYFPNIRKLNITLMCTLTGILEGNSTMNDNILIPAFMLICEQLLTSN